MRAFRDQTHAGLNALIAASDVELSDLAKGLIASDTVWDVSAPVEQLVGLDAVLEGFLRPLRSSLSQCRRRDEIFIGGTNIRAEGGTWCAAVTHYVGTFDAPLWGLAPSNRLAFLRAGEFYRVANGQIVEARIIVDLPDLMRQAGRSPYPFSLGTEMLFPGPATHDGVLPQGTRADASIALVERMIANLHAYDPVTMRSAGQTGEGGVWDDRMLWYGPAGIGANYTWAGFVADHRAPFLQAFPDRKGGNHYCRIGDGDYAAISGWPSMTMTHRAPYLGVPATGRDLTLRVMDFYRCDYTHDATGRLAENWVLLDYVDLFAQMGVDLIARGNADTSGDAQAG
ncbi:MAG: ester cyclase [Pseudomonadota bacterium]